MNCRSDSPAESDVTTFVFPGGWKADAERVLDNLKMFAETPAAKAFEAAHEQEYEVVVTITERRKT